MRVRDAAEGDIAWLTGYVTAGFDSEGYVPDKLRVTNAIRTCMYRGVAWIAEHRGERVGILGAIEQPIFWAERNELTVVALRSTYPGAGFSLLRRLRQHFESRHDLKHMVLNFAPENTDPRLDRLMQRWGGRRMRSYLIQK